MKHWCNTGLRFLGLFLTAWGSLLPQLTWAQVMANGLTPQDLTTAQNETPSSAAEIPVLAPDGFQDSVASADSDTQSASSVSLPHEKWSNKISGLNPRPSGAKVSLRLDSLLQAQWGLLGNPGMNIQQAWNSLSAKKIVKKPHLFNCTHSQTVVAVIDTGVDFTHQNLKGSSWVNVKEFRGKKGVDDDKNGFIDDTNGWDFTSNSPVIVDGHGHGTHLAGIITGQSREPNGFKGVCPGVSIMSLRYFASDMSGLKNLENTIRAIQYAVKNGANIINYSGGGASFAQDEYLALKEAHEKGILVVAAAGNERSDTAKKPYFPASYDLANIISVAGLGSDGRLIPASNWGAKTVDVAAPGGAILSLQQNQAYAYMNGTSQATAFVSGLAAMLWTLNPKLKAQEIKNIIEMSVNKNKNLAGKVVSQGNVDADQAVKLLFSFNSKTKFKKAGSNPRVLSGL